LNETSACGYSSLSPAAFETFYFNSPSATFACCDYIGFIGV